MTADSDSGYGTVTEIIGVYDVDAGAWAKASRIVGQLRGRSSCALCDITHSMGRRKSLWELLVASLPVPVTMLNRDELTADIANAVSAAGGAPIVLAVSDSDDLIRLLGPPQLAALGGSVDAFEARLWEALDDNRLAMPITQTPLGEG